MSKLIPILTLIFYFTTTANIAFGEELPLIKVSTHGKASAIPDQAHFNISFRTIDLEVETANKTINSRVKNFIDGLDRFELESQSLDSGQINISPSYQHHEKERVLQGYRVERTISFKLNQLNQLQELISFISTSKVSSINFVNYRYSNEELLKDEALSNAISKASKLAESIAEGFNVKLLKIHSVRHQAVRNNFPEMRLSHTMNHQMETANPSFNLKPIEIEAYIDVEFNFEE